MHVKLMWSRTQINEAIAEFQSDSMSSFVCSLELLPSANNHHIRLSLSRTERNPHYHHGRGRTHTAAFICLLSRQNSNGTKFVSLYVTVYSETV